MAFDYKITVFTPTYNRAYILGSLYQSLRRQTYRDFEWVIVDDGSSDDTQRLVSRWMTEGNFFPIRYHRQENGGKCRAVNAGLGLARGELFFNVDSDDYLTDDALEKIARWESELPRDRKYCGVSGNLGTTETETPNTPLADPYYDGTLLDRYSKVDGERALAFYTEVHRRYLYPECPGEKFMTEAVTWNRMAHDGYQMRFYNDIIWVYEYREDGLTRSGYDLFRNNPQGAGIFFREKAAFLGCSLIDRLALWYGFATDAADRCTREQIASYIGMPRWLVSPMLGLHALVQIIKKKR